MEVFKLVGKIAVENKDANKAIDETTDKAEKGSNTMSNVFKKVGAFIATAFAIDKIKDFGVSIIKAAADTQALNAQFEQTFKSGGAAEALEMINKQSKTLNVHVNDLKRNWSVYFSMFKGGGADVAQSLEMTERATRLASDAAAYYDKELDYVNEAMVSFLKGNFAMIDNIGVYTNEMEINRQSMDRYGKKWNELTTIQRENMALDLMEETYKRNGALGQGVREADNLINTLTRLKTTFAELLNVIGKPLLEPTIQGLKMLTKLIEDGIPKMQDLIKNGIDFEEIFKNIPWNTIGRVLLGAMVGMLIGVIDAAMDITFWIGIIAKYWQQILFLAIGIFLAPAKWVGQITSKIDDILRGIPLLGKLISFITKPFLNLMTNISKFGDDIGKAFVKSFDNSLNITNTLTKLKGNWQFTITYLKSYIDDARGFIINVFEKIGSGAAKPFNILKDTVKGVINTIKGFFDNLNIKLPKIDFPKIKLPHFTIKNWSINPIDWLKVKPTIGVEWYAKGGILTKPTMFGMNGNKAMVGGESGPEAILPIKELPKLLGLDKKEKEVNNNKTVNITVQNMNVLDKGDKDRTLQQLAFLSMV